MPTHPQQMAEESVIEIFKRASDSGRRFKTITTNENIMAYLKQELQMDFSRALNKMLFDFSVRIMILIYRY